jgi:hypothetical protein
MGAWIKNEDARLRREAIDYRLDATYRHWLLDEFQDTSKDEWNGLQPWIDEALTDQESSVFVVGDKKQAIYAWRGGEVGLFDELIEKYRGEKDNPLALNIDTMAESGLRGRDDHDRAVRRCRNGLEQRLGETCLRRIIDPSEQGRTCPGGDRGWGGT